MRSKFHTAEPSVPYSSKPSPHWGPTIVRDASSVPTAPGPWTVGEKRTRVAA